MCPSRARRGWICMIREEGLLLNSRGKNRCFTRSSCTDPESVGATSPIKRCGIGAEVSGFDRGTRWSRKAPVREARLARHIGCLGSCFAIGRGLLSTNTEQPNCLRPSRKPLGALLARAARPIEGERSGAA